MGSECSLPWDSESRSPSPTYGRYVHTLYLVQHRFQIIRLLEHSPRLQCQEPGGDETSAFDHICRDASPGYEGRGRTGTITKKNNIFSNFSRKTLLLPLDYLPYLQDYTNHWPLTWTNSDYIFQLFMISGPNETRYGERNEERF